MNLQSKAIIEQLLTDQLNSVKADLFFLEHQRTLSHYHRKIELDESTLGIEIFNLQMDTQALEKAIEEFTILSNGKN